MPLIFPPAQVQPAPSQAPLALDLAAALDRAKADNPGLRGAKARVAER
jgi:hypothetical protein